MINKIKNSPKIKEAIRYTFGCGCSLLIKIVVNYILSMFNLPITISYSLALVVIIFFSFWFHSRITFQRKFRDLADIIKSFFLYTPSVLGFNLVDYVIVVIGVKSLMSYLAETMTLNTLMIQTINAGCILLSSVILFALRFVIYKLILKRGNHSSANKEGTDSGGSK